MASLILEYSYTDKANIGAGHRVVTIKGHLKLLMRNEAIVLGSPHPQRGNLGPRNLRAGYTPLRNQAPVCAIRISANSRIRIGSDCWVRYGSNKSGQNEGTNDNKGKDCIHLGSGDHSPEKAGVGG